MGDAGGLIEGHVMQAEIRMDEDGPDRASPEMNTHSARLTCSRNHVCAGSSCERSCQIMAISYDGIGSGGTTT